MILFIWGRELKEMNLETLNVTRKSRGLACRTWAFGVYCEELGELSNLLNLLELDWFLEG